MGYQIEISDELGVARIEIEPPLEVEHRNSLMNALSIEDEAVEQTGSHTIIEMEEIDTDPAEDPYDNEARRMLAIQDDVTQAKKIGKFLSGRFGVNVDINPEVRILDQDQELVAA